MALMSNGIIVSPFSTLLCVSFSPTLFKFKALPLSLRPETRLAG